MDRYAKSSAAQVRTFFSDVWEEAVRMFARGGISLRIVERDGAMLKHPSGTPTFKCLDPGMINVVLTDRVPLDWDTGRSLAGATTIYEGTCVCVISMNEAHGNQFPYFGVNTVVHELLHVLMQDVWETRGGLAHGQGREARIDMYATKLWLFGEGAAVRKSGAACLRRFSGPKLSANGACREMERR